MALTEKNESNPSGKEDLELFRQWFDCVQDVDPKYLMKKDFELAKKIYEQLEKRVPNSINNQLI